MGGGSGLNSLGSAATLGLVPDITGSTAASNAADKQIGAANNANGTQYAEWQKQQQNMQPYLQAGQSGLSQLQGAMPDLTRQFSMNDFHESPGYQFQLNQGLGAVQRSAAAKGFLNSTGTMQNINNYAQGTANTEYQQALSNFTNNQSQRYSMLSGLAGMGMGANAQLAQGGQNYANQYGQNMSAIGNAGSAASMQGYNGMMGLMKTGATLGAAAMG